jgi:tetratricopeptide (TPR) repeat protein
MIDQADVSAIPAPPMGTFRLVLSDEARASLEAVREAQEAARVQARRQTRQARLWFLTALAALALAGFAARPRLSHWWQARRHPAAVARTAAVRPTPVQPVAAPAVAPPAAPAQAVAADSPAPAVVSPAPAVLSDEGCDTGAAHSSPWRLSPEACARAFALHPNDASLAMAVAHAEHARGHLPEGAQWAKRALAIDPDTAEAYILIARAEVAGGRPDEARGAYRHYLQLAPRGWHHAEARSALRERTK